MYKRDKELVADVSGNEREGTTTRLVTMENNIHISLGYVIIFIVGGNISVVIHLLSYRLILHRDM